MEIELERTFLLKKIPKGLKECDYIEIIDLYIPQSVPHPILRLRKIGDVFEMTKKAPKKKGDSSEQYEETILLSAEEFKSLSHLEGKKLRKIRYFYPWKGVKKDKADIDIYLDNFEGLAIVDFEFESVSDKDSFQMPDFCLADFTQEKSTAGGWLAGREYSDIKKHLDKYGYKKIFI